MWVGVADAAESVRARESNYQVPTVPSRLSASAPSSTENVTNTKTLSGRHWISTILSKEQGLGTEIHKPDDVRLCGPRFRP